MAKAPPSWVKHGASVWYSPALLPGVAGRPRVSAVVDGEPWLLGTPDDVGSFHSDARAWWGRHREAVCAVIRDVMQEGA